MQWPRNGPLRVLGAQHERPNNQHFGDPLRRRRANGFRASAEGWRRWDARAAEMGTRRLKHGFLPRTTHDLYIKYIGYRVQLGVIFVELGDLYGWELHCGF